MKVLTITTTKQVKVLNNSWCSSNCPYLKNYYGPRCFVKADGQGPKYHGIELFKEGLAVCRCDFCKDMAK